MLELLAIRFVELGAGLFALVALLQLLKKDQKGPPRALFFIGLLLALIQYRFALYLHGQSVHYPVWQTLGFISSIYAIGPAINSQFHSMLQFKLNRHRLPIRLQLVPALAALVFEAWFIFLPATRQVSLVDQSFEQHQLGIFYWLFLAGFAQVFAYLVYFNLKYRRLKIDLDLHYNRYFSVLISTPLLAVAGLGSGFLAPVDWLFLASASLLTLVAILILIIEIRYPKFFETLESEIKERYARTQLTGLNIEELRQKLEQLMVQEQLYLDTSIRSSQVAKELQITTNQLSRILNEQYKKNFNEFVNEYRVETAKTLLLEDQEKTVLTIAYEAGFNSKSTFNNQFQKLTGLSPVEFRRKGKK